METRQRIPFKDVVSRVLDQSDGRVRWVASRRSRSMLSLKDGTRDAQPGWKAAGRVSRYFTSSRSHS